MININPNRINVPRSGTGRPGERKRQQTDSRSNPVIPARAHVNVIPQPESLSTMIRSAVAAMRDGTYWDRGTILNILA
ncbi:MAG: hypothetical protein ACN2B6_09840 [Rickettsiales bacterium]